LFLQDQKNYYVRISKRDIFSLIIFKSIILPFFGVIYVLIAHNQFQDNRSLIFTAFIQWIIPTSIDIIAIIQVKEINVKDSCLIIFIQWIVFVILSNFIHIPPFLSIING